MVPSCQAWHEYLVTKGAHEWLEGGEDWGNRDASDSKGGLGETEMSSDLNVEDDGFGRLLDTTRAHSLMQELPYFLSRSSLERTNFLNSS